VLHRFTWKHNELATFHLSNGETLEEIKCADLEGLRHEMKFKYFDQKMDSLGLIKNFYSTVFYTFYGESLTRNNNCD
jgi:hypothetical protein